MDGDMPAAPGAAHSAAIAPGQLSSKTTWAPQLGMGAAALPLPSMPSAAPSGTMPRPAYGPGGCFSWLLHLSTKPTLPPVYSAATPPAKSPVLFNTARLRHACPSPLHAQGPPLP